MWMIIRKYDINLKQRMNAKKTMKINVKCLKENTYICVLMKCLRENAYMFNKMSKWVKTKF